MPEGPSPAESSAPSQIKLYSPGVLALYFIFGNIPIGFALYGLNVARRGERLFGYLLFCVAVLGLIALMLVALAGRSFRGWFLLGVLIGLAVMSLEREPYRRAVRSGATSARWWPPLVAVIAVFLVVILLAPD